MLQAFDFDYPRQSDVFGQRESTFECPVCRVEVSADGICECVESQPDYEDDYFDHDDQYDLDSGLESVYGPSDEGQYDYEY